MAIRKAVRIYDLARELQQDTKRVMEDLRRVGANVSVASNSVSAEHAEKVRLKYFPRTEIAPKRQIKIIKKIPISSVIAATVERNAKNLDLSNRDLDPHGLLEWIPDILSIEGLETLDLSSNRLETIPPNLFQLPNLRELNLTKNGLIGLPNSITNLQELEVLNLSNNQLGLLPFLGDFSMASLRQLNIDRNNFTSFPEEILGQISLRTLNLNQNRIDEIPVSIARLFDLEWLGLDGNRLQILPREIGDLSRLVFFYLGGNRISRLPVEIGNLSNLRQLFLNANELTEITELLPLTGLQRLDLSENPLDIPAEILSAYDNPQEILKYYIESLKGTAPFNEGKIILVGQGRVGKTSLREAIMSDVHKAKTDQKKTEGLQVVEWPLDVKDRGKIRLNIWDFGGQEVYHATNQFFFKSGLYILVVDIDERVEWRTNRIEYWLKKIQTLTEGNSLTDGFKTPVIIVGNKSDANTAKSELFDLEMLRIKFTKLEIANFIRVACHTGMNIYEVIREIQLHLEKIGVYEEFPRPYLEIKTLIQESGKNFLSRAEFTELAKEDVDQKLYVLEKIGAITTFAHSQQQELKDLIVVKPRWITDGIYKILSANYLLDENKGEVGVEEVKAILDDSEYPQKEAIIEMMKEYDICFAQIKNKKNLLMFPSYFSVIKPSIREFNTDVISFRYSFKILLDNVFPQFVVNLDKAIFQNTLFWRTGVRILKDDKLAVVEVDLEENTILITVEGENFLERRRLLDDLRAKFEEIISKQEAGVEISVPKHPRLFVDYRNLINLQREGEVELPVEGLGRFSIDYLLYEAETNACESEEHLIINETEDAEESQIEKLANEISRIETLVDKVDQEARRLARFYSFWFFVPTAIILGFWLWIIEYVGWGQMEKFTYYVGIAVSVVVLAISVYTLEEHNPLKPSRTFEREKSRLYETFGIDLADLEYKKTKLLDLKNR